MFWSSGWPPAWPSSEPRSAISVASCRCASISPVSSEIASAVAGSGTDVKIMLTYRISLSKTKCMVHNVTYISHCKILLESFNPILVSEYQAQKAIQFSKAWRECKSSNRGLLCILVLHWTCLVFWRGLSIIVWAVAILQTITLAEIT